MSTVSTTVLNRPTTLALSKKVVYVTICDASIIRRDEHSTESSLILMKNLKKLAGWTDPDWHTMDVVSTEDDGRDITWCTEMVRTLLTTCALNESLLARKYPVIICWTWSFLVGQKHRTARARIAEEDVYMKIATFPYQLNYLRQEVKDVRCINICRVKTCHLLRSFSDNFYEESLDLSGHQRQTCAHKLQTTVDVWMPWENSMRKGIHHGILNKFNILITPGNKRNGIHRLREPDVDDDDDDDKWIARFRDNSHRWSSPSKEAAPTGQRVGRDWPGVSAFVLCENT